MSTNRFEQVKRRSYHAFLTAGLELILERGYDHVSVTDIAQLADYGRSTFYMHFRDKEQLAWTLLQNQFEQLDRQVNTAVQDLASPARELLAWRMIFMTIDEQRPFFLKMDGEFSRRLRQQQKTYLINSFERQLEDGFYSLMEDIPPAIGARFVVGALLEILEYWLLHPEAGDPQTMAHHLFRLVYRQDPTVYETGETGINIKEQTR